ncbi:MAG: bifunctional glutamate N-acetyltransferase/amino-acid acetyltransferase ArgJ [Nitrospinota bacterium]|jgi:glutamate N-acetyltransferase/amino-acid N-acetyltransferase|nr:bifunctional glutamate N-acetyltransferase/amino-acid acetyltransferase ArgJ [Nitrospinota bacterium]MDP7580552.1 bifunctional glutamate N-acetyltransferase/amino-acid acetyltransferase ArgJ [Nitrospinota bacterium]HJN02787.1 bifunctional glutamate N-acetyltransferase/amino-acid acetyltransferase ArgJ [Nitrospinota bacterium]
MKEIMGGITAVQGFKAAGVMCGIKKNNKKDLAMIYSTVPSVAAGVFTTNKVFSPSVQLCRENILSPVARAIVANSGNANACVGNQGYLDAKKIVQLTAEKLEIVPEEVLIASTGIIGEPLPMNKIETGIPNLVNALNENGSKDAAEGILTTDTFTKTVDVEISVSGTKVRLVGIAKGAGMIHPDMATMLAFITTDAAIEKKTLQELLKESTDKSFNMITVDGDTSTNDTVIILANSLAKNKIIRGKSTSSKIFLEALDFVTSKLARMIVKDGEGATKLIEVHVKGARAFHDAKAIALAISRSNLVKTAFFGEDANWGRIIAAAGTAGVSYDPDKMDMFFGEEHVLKNGLYCGNEREKAIETVIKGQEIVLTLNLNSGNEQARMFTCDLSPEYIKINAEYRS